MVWMILCVNKLKLIADESLTVRGCMNTLIRISQWLALNASSNNITMGDTCYQSTIGTNDGVYFKHHFISDAQSQLAPASARVCFCSSADKCNNQMWNEMTKKGSIQYTITTSLIIILLLSLYSINNY
jgi:hypothetical protein